MHKAVQKPKERRKSSLVLSEHQQNPPLLPLNGALFHVTIEQEHAKKASIKA